MRGFFDREPTEHTQLHDFCERRVDRLEAFERMIERKNRDLTGRRGLIRFINWHRAYTVPSFTGRVATGVVDQDSAHDLRRRAKKMRSILPVDMTLINEPQIDLVNQCGRLEGVVDPLP